ncbi:MAG: hypothetical protein EBR82_20210 [Caulobacteraceae bacterium]|nr:hypothetical protein [Caulobacteraceae bacterium]
MAAPTTTDLTNFLTTIGVTASASADLSALLTSATQEFELRTGRRKYQGDAGTTAIRYTLPWPTGKYIRLVISDCWAISEVRINYSGAGTGTVLTEWDDFIHWPEDHAQKNAPVEEIRFERVPTTEPGSILVTGKLGYASSMPAAVFEAIVCRAASQLIIQQSGTSGAISEEKQGDRSVKYSLEAGRATTDELRKKFEQVVSRYLKVVS